jgi:hypothetical protein
MLPAQLIVSGPEEAGLHCVSTDSLTEGRCDHREEIVRNKTDHQQGLQLFELDYTHCQLICKRLPKRCGALDATG